MSRNRALAAGLARGAVEADKRVIKLRKEVAELQARVIELEEQLAAERHNNITDKAYALHMDSLRRR